MRNILLALLFLILGCSGPQTAGGVSEAGNGFIQITCITAELTPVDNLSLNLNRSDYRAGIDPATGLKAVTGSDGKTMPIAVPAGSWAVFAEQSILGMGISYGKTVVGDTTRITVILEPSGNVKVTDSTVKTIIVPGSPRSFTLKSGATALPGGTFVVELKRDSAASSTASIVVIPRETTTISKTSAFTRIFISNMIDKVYNIDFDGESIAYATANGIVLERNGIRTHLTTDNSPLKSNWIRDIRISGDSLLAATDSGLVLFTKSDTIFYRAGKELIDDWVIEFSDSPEGIWFITKAEAGLIKNGKIINQYPSKQFFGSITLNSIDRLTDNNLIVAGNLGIFRYNKGTWDEDTLFTKLKFTGVISSVVGAVDTLLVGSSQSGIYSKKDTIWSLESTPLSIVHCGIPTKKGSVFGGGTGQLITKISNTYKEETIASKMIISLNLRDDGSLWVGTMGDGVIVLPGF